MHQVICGIEQLMSDKTLNSHKIVAHRDLKFENIMQEDLADGSKRFRIIDFPTVKLSAKNDGHMVDYTHLGFFSYSNTAPEDVVEDYEVSEKTDVFALGMMLAELFGIWEYTLSRNPLSLLFKCVRTVDVSNSVECSKFFKSLN